MWGLEHSELTSVVNSPTITSRLSRYSYGMAFSHPYDPSKHLIEDCYLDTSDGTYQAKGQMEWLLKRVCRPILSSNSNNTYDQQGEVVEEGKVLNTSCVVTVQVGFWDSGMRLFQQELYYNDEPTPPTRKTDGKIYPSPILRPPAIAFFM